MGNLGIYLNLKIKIKTLTKIRLDYLESQCQFYGNKADINLGIYLNLKIKIKSLTKIRLDYLESQCQFYGNKAEINLGIYLNLKIKNKNSHENPVGLPGVTVPILWQ